MSTPTKLTPHRPDPPTVEMSGHAGRGYTLNHHIPSVIKKLLEVAGLNGRFNYNVTGLLPQIRFDQSPGIKIKGDTKSCSLVVNVGNGGQYVGYIYSLNGGPRGQELFQILDKVCSGRYFYPLRFEAERKKLEREAALEKMAESKQVAGPAPADPPVAVQNPPAEAAPVLPDAKVEQVQQMAPATQTVAEEQSVKYDSYFEDPKNLHLAVTAMVVWCNGEINRPFNLHQFAKVLREGGVEIDLSQIVDQIRTCRLLMVREFVVRINESAPALYNITQKAVDFASQPVPDKPVPTARQLRGRSKINRASDPESEAPQDPRAALLAIRKKVDERRLLQQQISVAQQEETSLKPAEMDLEEKKLKGEMASLEKRLTDLRKGLDDLENRRNKLSEVRIRISDLKEKLADPDLVRAVQEFDEYKKLLE